jgi:phosphate-selective porin OprO/OprP
VPPTRSAPLPVPFRLVLVLLAIGAPAAAIDDETTATPTPTAEAQPSVTGGAVEEHRAQEASEPGATAAPESHLFDLRIYWERGLNYRFRQRVRLGGVVTESTFFEKDATLNGRIGLKLGVDVAGYLPRGSVPHLGTRFDLRRALFYTTGEFNFLVPILFKVDLGGVGDQLYVSDVYLWAQGVPYVGTIKIGQFDAPMSLEALTGSTYETFMEYGSPVEAFAPGLKIGLQIADHSANGRATWAFGYFTDGQDVDVGDASASVARLTGRATWLAVRPRTAADTLIHLGVSGSYVLSSRDRIRYESRPESFLAQDLVDTGDLDTNDAFPFGLEFAAKRGPVTLQVEYMASTLDTRDFGSAYLDGAYGSASWFLTGEQRPYDASVAKMGALVPRQDFDPFAHTWGAWEIATRTSWLDLTDGQIRGGRMVIFAAGVNWYWNRYIRILFNANFAHTYDGRYSGELGILQSRFQLAF